MDVLAQSFDMIWFGPFEANLRTGELRKHGRKIKLQEKPFEILALLLMSGGMMVTREEIRSVVWAENQHGVFDHHINVAMTKLRHALSDCPVKPRFVETIGSRGYRFIVPVSVTEDGSVSAEQNIRRATASKFKYYFGTPLPLSVSSRANFPALRSERNKYQVLTGK